MALTVVYVLREVDPTCEPVEPAHLNKDKGVALGDDNYQAVL